MKVSELTRLAGLSPDDDILVVRSDVGPGLATKSGGRAVSLSGLSTDDVVTEALDRAWPIGSYYKGEDDPPPIGEWTEVYGTYLYAMGSSGTAGLTGGVEAVTLTSSNLPSHTHSNTLSSTTTHTHSTPTLSHGHTVGTLNSHTHTISNSSHTHSIQSHYHSGPQHGHRYTNVTCCANERTDCGTPPSGVGAGFKDRLLYSTGYNPPSGGDTKDWDPPTTGSTSVTMYLDSSSSTCDLVYANNIPFSTIYSGSPLDSATAYSTFSSVSTSAGSTNSAGSGAAHINIPPTQICKIWRRVS